MKFYTPYNLPDNWNDLSSLKCEDISLTTQADKDDADINTIVRRFGLTGELPSGVAVPEYDDFTMIPNDYHAALMFLEAADETFMTMPADVRSRFDNDAGKFLEFVQTPSNYDEAVSLGLVFKPASDVSSKSDPKEVPAAGVEQ